jgi:phospholipid/cholesterol/gamma-HCH transport system permease protein
MLLDPVGRVGVSAQERAKTLLGMIRLAYAAVKSIVLERRRGQRQVIGNILSQIYFTAVQPLPFFALTGLIFGFVMLVECDQVLRAYTLGAYVPPLVTTGLIREVAPLVIAMVLVGRSGPAIATELGYMSLNKEVDALSLSGVNVDYFLVVPRIVGVTIATVLLLVFFSAVGLAGGFVLGRSLDLVSKTLLWDSLAEAITVRTIVLAVVKAAIFGAFTATANCYHGLHVGDSFTEIPKANARGAQLSLVLCFVANGVISVYAVL